MKKDVVAYLAKEGVTKDDFIDRSSRPQRIEINHDDLVAELYIKRKESTPQWLELFSDIDISDALRKQSTLRGLLLVESGDRLIALTFGHGRSLIKQHLIVRGFGLRVAMNLGNPKQLKSIDKSTLDKVSLNTRSQAAKNTGVEDFGFEFDHEILKSLTAIVDGDDEDLEIVSGKDSVSLYTDIRFDTIQEIVDRLIEAYKLEDFRRTYPWAEDIEPERDGLIVDALDELVVTKLNRGEIDGLWMSPPEIIDYMDFSGFVYRQRDPIVKYQELNLPSFISDAGFRGDLTVSSLKSKKVCIYNASESYKEHWSAFRCLNGEMDLDGARYILNDGQWYKIKQSFYEEVCDFFNGIKKSNLLFPDYQGRKEGPYLRSIANDVDLALLDQKWVRPNGVTNNLEFCDLLSSCNGIIHVKKYGASSVLNHLFAQAYQSIEMLVNSPEVIERVNEHLANTKLTLNFDPNISPRVQRIVLAIMDHRNGDLDIPFFAKVNLRQYVRKITAMGFAVELAKINMGLPMTDLELKAEEKALA
ncbi:TIGR04141 family sporadically distributed protein [Bacterioplanoides sp.]|uniref:TIGR04141 family sporadically distributed protein n=1 Tax=Bacterioplanoides sp. TaxID=2066072 RepID=UPI003B58E20A